MDYLFADKRKTSVGVFLYSTAQLGSARIALAQPFSFIFSKMNEAGFFQIAP